jgi:anti-sigma regulatory factor (Ser/Thr protein kinase)
MARQHRAGAPVIEHSGPLSFATVLCFELGEIELVDARDRLRVWLQAVGLPERDLGEVLTAAGEACTNAFEHAGNGGGPPTGWIEATVSGDVLRIVIGDLGRWKEPNPTPPITRGRGRLLMANLVDTMRLSTGPDGTTVELTKNLRPA